MRLTLETLRGACTLVAVDVIHVEREPSLLEQLAYKAEMWPEELRELLRAEVKRRKAVTAEARSSTR